MNERKSFDQLLAEGSVIVLDGANHDIAALPAEDWAAFVAHFKKQNLALVFSAGAGVNAAVLAATAAKVTVGVWSDADIIEQASSIDGARWILETSLKRAGNLNPKTVIDAMPHGLKIDKAAIILELSGLVRWRQSTGDDDDKTKGGADENPPTELTGEK